MLVSRRVQAFSICISLVSSVLRVPFHSSQLSRSSTTLKHQLPLNLHINFVWFLVATGISKVKYLVNAFDWQTFKTSPEIIFPGRWSLTFHRRSIFNLNVFEFNWMVLSTSNEEAGGGRNSRDYLGLRTLAFFFIFFSVWICSHSRLDANHFLRPLQSPACTYFVTVCHPTHHCEGNILARFEWRHLRRWELSDFLIVR